jgi:hypothetical protein
VLTEDPSASFKVSFKKEPIRYMEKEEHSCVWPNRVEKGKGPYYGHYERRISSRLLQRMPVVMVSTKKRPCQEEIQTITS